jgi:hypothetical protein
MMESASTAERLGTKGLEQVSNMTWPRAVGRLLAVTP